MKRNTIIGTLALLAASLLAAQAGTKDDVTAAAKKLSEKSYSWKTSSETPGGGGGGGGGGGARGRGGFGSQEGKMSADGIAAITMGAGENATVAYVKGEKAVVKRENEWKTLEELSADGGGGGGGRGRGAAMMLRNYKSPATRATELIGRVQDLKSDDGAYTGDLTEEGAKALLSFGGRGGAGGPEVSGAKGTVKFWVKDGVLTKYETKVQGKVSFNGNDRDVNRTTTTEFQDIGTTAVTVPDDAKKKLS
jgi:hypothetical protein